MSEDLSDEVKRTYENKKLTLKQEAISVLKEMNDKIKLKKNEIYKEVASKEGS
ncbi:MAG: hypothetical protein LUQ46_01130 [Candidatus Methanomethyliaceae archaeon]|nr:hypothetical protein [Candidatus Methanomethyliaceae archaeon]MDD1766851.1 hypothetical protein [Candidatus Methanomethyliaceae archaeon]